VSDTPTSPYSPAALAHFRTLILAKGQEVANKLTDIMARKDVSLADLDLFSREPGETKEQRLRRFLNHLMATLRSLDKPTFGRCDGCGQPIPEAELREMPWADRCRRCPPT